MILQYKIANLELYGWQKNYHNKEIVTISVVTITKRMCIEHFLRNAGPVSTAFTEYRHRATQSHKGKMDGFATIGRFWQWGRGGSHTEWCKKCLLSSEKWARILKFGLMGFALAGYLPGRNWAWVFKHAGIYFLHNSVYPRHCMW